MKKILFTIFIFISLVKITDVLMVKFTGLGNPLIYQHSKIFGYDLKNNQSIKRRGNNISINDFGMRTNKNWGVNYDKKLLFIGDSVTFGGSIVNNKETFVSRICEKIKKKNTICGNYSFNGYGIEAISKKLKYRNFDDEDFIIIVIIGNDFERGLHSLSVQPYFSKKIDNFLPALTELFFIVVDKYRNLIRFDFSAISEDKNLYLKYQVEQIKEFKKILFSTQKNYLIFYSPEYEEFQRKNKYQYIKKIFNENNINFYDLTKDLDKYKNQIYYDGVHLNKFGHEIYGKIIYDLIITQLNF